MTARYNNWLTGLMIASVICFLAIDFAEARRGGGGGRGMMRGGPAASGSFNRSRVQPQRSRSRQNMNRGNVDRGNMNRGNVNRDNMNQRQGNRQDNLDQRQENRQDRFDQRQENVDERQDFREDVYKDRKDYYEDRQDWYEDRWRAGAFLTVTSWNRMGCSYTTVLVDGVTYYDCNGVRYERVLRGTEVTYIIVS